MTEESVHTEGRGEQASTEKALNLALSLVTKAQGKREKTLSIVAKPGSCYGNLDVDGTKTQDRRRIENIKVSPVQRTAHPRGVQKMTMSCSSALVSQRETGHEHPRHLRTAHATFLF